MTVQNFIIDTLKPIDADKLHQFTVDNKERLRYYFPKTLAANSSLEQSKDYIVLKHNESQQKTNFTFAVRDKDTQEIAGLVIIKKIDWTKLQAEFAYCIGSKFEKKGITSFAVAEILKYSFENLGLKTLQIIVHKSNFGSIKVATNNGFTWQRTLTNEFTPTNESPLDMELYEFTNEK